MLADLSLILFMVTAAAMAEKPPAPPKPSPQSASQTADIPTLAEPLAIYRQRAGAPPLSAWLAAQSADPRQQLTITARYGPGGMTAALAQAQALARQAGAMGRAARIVIEPGTSDLVATLAFDRPPDLAVKAASSQLAHSLLSGTSNPASKDHNP